VIPIRYLNACYTFDAARNVLDPFDQKQPKTSAPLAPAERIYWIDRQMADRKDVSARALIEHNPDRRAWPQPAVACEQALHCAGRNVNPNPAIRLDDFRNAGSLDRRGDGREQKRLTGVEKEQPFNGVPQVGRYCRCEQDPFEFFIFETGVLDETIRLLVVNTRHNHWMIRRSVEALCQSLSI
jgi:hypothetical protein